MEALSKFFMNAPVPPDTLAPSLWLIIALPLLGAFVCGVFGRMLGRANVNLVACASVLGSFLLSVLALWATNHLGPTGVTSLKSAFAQGSSLHAFGYDYGTWFSAGEFRVNFGLVVDHLSGSLMLVITGVGFLIHLYSTSYMEHDEGYWRYFAYLNLFVAAMLTLVMADSLVLLFVGWEGVGMASYLLIGFWYTDSAKAWAGRKAFVTNRIGDFAFLIGSFLLVLVIASFANQADANNYVGFSSPSLFKQGLEDKGPLAFKALETLSNGVMNGGAVGLESAIASGPLAGYTYGGVLTVALLLFLLGAAGKSAQLPLYVWLPDAMAGPTPVSALIHAATMVTAGVYLFCRISYLLVLSPTAMATIAVVGTLTSLLAALIAFAQDDIKKVLAYSTVSQLGIMFMGVGMGVFWAAVAHLITHAFFKACLFLGAGSVMHGNGDETDIKKLGGLRHEMKLTWFTFLVATLAITGIVPLSGFFSKDALFHGIHHNELPGFGWTSSFVYYTGLLIAACTAFYMTRLYLLTFEGKRSPEAKLAHAHESALPMTLPLLVLAVLSIVGAAYALPLMSYRGSPQMMLENYLLPVFSAARRISTLRGLKLAELQESIPSLVDYAKAWVVAMVGGGSAAFLYLKFFPAQEGKPVPAPARFVRRLAQNKFYVDELYELAVIRPVRLGSEILYKVLDSIIIDTTAVRGTAWLTSRMGSLLRYVQTGDAQAYAAVMALALLGGAAYALLQVLQ